MLILASDNLKRTTSLYHLCKGICNWKNEVQPEEKERCRALQLSWRQSFGVCETVVHSFLLGKLFKLNQAFDFLVKSLAKQWRKLYPIEVSLSALPVG